MKLYVKNTLIIGTLFATSTAFAASIDIRQEYKHESESYASRIKMDGSTGNHNYSIEAKQKGKPFSEYEAGDNEFVYSYNINLDSHWRIQPGMPITFGSDSVTYKPQVRVQYKADSGLTAKLRYRHEFRDYTSESSSDNFQKSKITANLDYTIEQIQLGFETNYEKRLDNKQPLFDNKDYNWDMNLKVGYNIEDTAWRPYVEFGNVSVSSDSDKRQLRSRAGITYRF